MKRTATYKTKHEGLELEVVVTDERQVFGRQEYRVESGKVFFWVTADKLSNFRQVPA